MWIKNVCGDGLINAAHIKAFYIKNNTLIQITILLEGCTDTIPMAELSSVPNAKKLINKIFQQISKNTQVIDLGILVNQIESEK